MNIFLIDTLDFLDNNIFKYERIPLREAVEMIKSNPWTSYLQSIESEHLLKKTTNENIYRNTTIPVMKAGDVGIILQWYLETPIFATEIYDNSIPYTIGKITVLRTQ